MLPSHGKELLKSAARLQALCGFLRCRKALQQGAMAVGTQEKLWPEKGGQPETSHLTKASSRSIESQGGRGQLCVWAKMNRLEVILLVLLVVFAGSRKHLQH